MDRVRKARQTVEGVGWWRTELPRMDKRTFRGAISGIAVTLAVGLLAGPGAMAQAPPRPVVEVPPDVLAKAAAVAADMCSGVGTPRTATWPEATIVEMTSSQRAGLNAVGVDVMHLLSCEKQLPFTDRAPPPGYGILTAAVYVGRVVNPTSDRVTRAYPVLTSILKARGTNIRETPVEGIGTQAVALSGDTMNANGLALELQALSAMITRGILLGGEAKGERGTRRQLITTTTARISKFIDAQSW